MGAEHRARTFAAFALAVAVFAPTVAFAKTLEGAGGGAEPVDGVVAGPLIAGPPPPMLVPASLAPMIVPPAEPVAEAGPEDEPAPETIAGDESDSTEPTENPSPSTVPRTSSGDAAGAASAPARPAAVGSAPTPTSPPPGVGARIAGPALPRQLIPPPPPTALALRAGPDASPVAPTTTNPTIPSELVARPEPTTGGSSTVASSAVVVIPDGVGSSNCTSLPQPGPTNALLDWSTSRTAEITDGRDLRSRAWITASDDGLLPPGAAGTFAAYLLEPNSLAILAVFREAGDGTGGSDRPSRPVPDLRIADCDGGPAAGISPGSYLLRYSITETPDPSASIQNETFLSPPFSVRVMAGPTAPTPISAGPNVSQS